MASVCHPTECRWSELTVTEQEAHPQKQNVLFMKDFQQSNWKESSRSRKGRATLWSLPCQDPIRAPLSVKPETEVAETARSQDGTLELLFIFSIVFHI